MPLNSYSPGTLNLRWCRVCRAERGVSNGRFMVHWLKGTIKINLNGKADGQTCPISKRRAPLMRGAP
jgi:hypothetical protein